MTNDERQQRRERIKRGARASFNASACADVFDKLSFQAQRKLENEFESGLIAAGWEQPLPAPVPAVIETPEEVAERVVSHSEGWAIVGNMGEPNSWFGTSADHHVTKQAIASIIRERDAAHAAQLAQAREAALDEAAGIAVSHKALFLADAIRELKARPVAAGGK